MSLQVGLLFFLVATATISIQPTSFASAIQVEGDRHLQLVYGDINGNTSEEVCQSFQNEFYYEPPHTRSCKCEGSNTTGYTVECADNCYSCLGDVCWTMSISTNLLWPPTGTDDPNFSEMNPSGTAYESIGMSSNFETMCHQMQGYGAKEEICEIYEYQNGEWSTTITVGEEQCTRTDPWRDLSSYDIDCSNLGYGVGPMEMINGSGIPQGSVFEAFWKMGQSLDPINERIVPDSCSEQSSSNSSTSPTAGGGGGVSDPSPTSWAVLEFAISFSSVGILPGVISVLYL